MKLLGFRLRAWWIGPAPSLERPKFYTDEGLRFRQLAARKRLEREGKYLVPKVELVARESSHK